MASSSGYDKSHMLVGAKVCGAKVCELTEVLLWFVCGNFEVFPYAIPTWLSTGQTLIEIFEETSLISVYI